MERSLECRREGIDWLRRHQRETLCLAAEILELLEHEWQSQAQQLALDWFNEHLKT